MAAKYTGTGIGYGGEITAEIEVEGRVVTRVTLTGQDETAAIGDEALNRLERLFVEAQTPEVDVVSGATSTWAGARDAVRSAMQEAGLIARTEVVEKTIVIDTELLVVGCGVSGIAAALAAGERGVRVFMIDRTESFGGNGRWATGGFFVETGQQREAGVAYTVKQAYEEAMYFANYLCDPILMRLVLGEAAATVRWADSHGAGFYLLPHQKMICNNNKPLAYHGWDGKEAIAHFRRRLESMENVEICLGALGAGLIQKADGTVVGAKAQKRDGQRLHINARAVYIGTGGYIANPAMIKEAVGEDVYRYLVADAPPVSDGSGIQMAWKAGAGKKGEKILGTHGGRTGLGPGMAGLPGCDLLMNLPILWVNDKGRRFMNEEVIYNSLFYSNVLQAQGGRAFIVFDQASIDQWKTRTIPLKMHFWDRFGENGGYYCPAVTTFDEDFAAAEEGRMGFRAGTVEALAAKAGMVPAVLARTINNYNRYVETGRDEEFFKSAENLRYPVCDGPFYALQCNLQAQGTCGGIQVNDRLEVVTKEGKTIPGLYAGGSDAGGLYAGSYTIHAGMGISWALTSGRLAGRSAAEHIASLRKNSVIVGKESKG